ncbi:MAG: DUF5320 domain-containing protein [Candidatus Gracilibacteria bacterium]|jgi:hypothetical protein
MPNFDKTGPAGQGPMTGQGLGSCSGNQQSNIAGRRGRGMGFGKGMGCCVRDFSRKASVSLEDQEKFLENRLEAVRKLKKSNPKK